MTLPFESVLGYGVGEPATEVGAAEQSRGRTETSTLLKAAQALITHNDREFFRHQNEILVASKDERARQRTAQEIWTRAATIVARSVTLENERQALREGLLQWLNNDVQPERQTDEAPKQRWLVDWFLDMLGEILKALVKEALVELLLPGAHLIVPPTGLVDAIFTACKLLEITEAA